ncbi:major facilitator superfamily domain-containing protein, partial [Cyathus striatus]
MGRLTDVNDASSTNTSKEAYDSDTAPTVDVAVLKKATLKMDSSVLPLVGLIYLLSWLDRANIGNARVAGLQRDLHLTDMQYQIGITMMFIPYILSELPSNLILRKVGARLLLSCLLISWGIVIWYTNLTLTGFVSSYAGLVVVRLLLGLFEGPIYPGIVLYLSSMYTREQLSLRIALFFSSASLSGAFSGLLAAAIENMDGIGGKAGWRWIFIL